MNLSTGDDRTNTGAMRIDKPRIPRDGLQLHLGCGPHAEPGWINVDKSWMAKVSRMEPAVRALSRLGVLSEQQATTRWPREVIRRNLAGPLDWPSGGARAIYSSHMVEHLERSEARFFLEECRRVLKPAGVLRLVLPNLETLVERYQKIKAAGDTRAADEFMEFMYVIPSSADQSRLRRAAMRFIHRAHRWMYDPDSMQALLRDVGFERVTQCSFRVGACPSLDTLESRENDLYEASSFYVEGFKL